MIRFSKEKVLLLHRIITESTGGSMGVRDEALLESALESAFSGYGDEEFYPTKEEKGACGVSNCPLRACPSCFRSLYNFILLSCSMLDYQAEQLFI